MLPLCYPYATPMLPLCYHYATTMLHLCDPYATPMLPLRYPYATRIVRPLPPCSLVLFQTHPSSMPQRSTREVLKTLVDSDRQYEYVDSSDEDRGGSVEAKDTPTACSIDLLHDTNPASCTPSQPQLPVMPCHCLRSAFHSL